ncbi:hypothetical protein KKC32_00080 [Patescibacteria group bacterium]|nr:hypothetical protein [Patescibacteria group bacterium]
MAINSKRIFELVRKTGNPCFVADADNEEVYVIMRAADYEALVLEEQDIESLTEEQLLDKINLEIDQWQSVQPEIDSSEWREDWDMDDEEDEDDERYYIEPVD